MEKLHAWGTGVITTPEPHTHASPRLPAQATGSKSRKAGDPPTTAFAEVLIAGEHHRPKVVTFPSAIRAVNSYR